MAPILMGSPAGGAAKACERGARAQRAPRAARAMRRMATPSNPVYASPTDQSAESQKKGELCRVDAPAQDGEDEVPLLVVAGDDGGHLRARAQLPEEVVPRLHEDPLEELHQPLPGEGQALHPRGVEDAGEVEVEDRGDLAGQGRVVDAGALGDEADHLRMGDVEVDGGARDQGEALQEVGREAPSLALQARVEVVVEAGVGELYEIEVELLLRGDV